MKKLIVLIIIVFNPTAFAGVCYVTQGEINGVSYGEVDPCEGAKETKGAAATICFQTPFDEKKCIDVEPKGKVPKDLSELSKSQPSPSFFQVLSRLFKPQQDASYGGKRLKSSKTLAGYPTGDILLPTQALTFSTIPEVQKTISRFELFLDGNKSPVFASPNVKSGISIPTGTLKPNTQYAWVAKSAKQTYSGQFSTAHPEDQQTFEEELKKATSAGDASSTTFVILKAALAKDYGYTFDMQQAMDKARDTLTR